MVDIWLEMHAQTHHNAEGLASGHYDVALTPYGRTQAQTILRQRYAGQRYDAAYASDTQRAYETASLMFGSAFTSISTVSPRSNFAVPAAAIIAALSVVRIGLG